ncbi:YicC/YloC family endoribonuclease [Novispirillum sp. DQ9]|uniref:YicC/YloC family endoribonuclease n=1 Tax=Novispirillum sp. DQ9 TaxID=3398612 RepID=UPI003C79CC8C
MTVSSMTGFARAHAEQAAPPTCPPLAWTWEARSVNGKGLDVRLRLPPGYEALEIPAREAATRRFSRGNITLSLSVQVRADAAPAAVQVNEALLRQLMDMARDLPPHVAPPTFDGLLAVRGVLVAADETAMDEDTRAAHEAAVLRSLDDALAALAAARDDEGARLAGVLAGHLATVEALTAQAADTAQMRPEAARERLRAQVQALLEASPALPEDRLAQECAVLATKLDVREELDRLTAHVAQARELMAATGACGRRLDFLCQEFNREANTLCSKAQDTTLTRIGLDLKAVIDQLREQVQNIE